MLAILAHRFGDLDLADEAVQDALLEAVETWPVRGVPDDRAAWLMTVARRKAIDQIRRTTSARRRLLTAGPDLAERAEPAERRAFLAEEGSDTYVPDERLRLLLLCCHPAINRDAQVALTLRLVGGLTTHEIGAAFLTPEPTITQRIVRAKRKIRDAGIAMSIPDHLDDRVDALLAVLYLTFNEGYLSTSATEVVRVELADEAIRLTQVTADLLPDASEVRGLLALMLYQRARFATRTSTTGDLVLLADQDRTRWDGAMITVANRVMAPVLASRAAGPYVVQAVIASQHANARTHADTDWPAIVAAYDRLIALTGSPVARLNHAVAVGMADGPRAGLSLVEELQAAEPALAGFHLLHACLADLRLRAGDEAGAATAYARAAALATNPVERRHVEARLASLRAGGGLS